MMNIESWTDSNSNDIKDIKSAIDSTLLDIFRFIKNDNSLDVFHVCRSKCDELGMWTAYMAYKSDDECYLPLPHAKNYFEAVQECLVWAGYVDYFYD